MLYTKAMIWVNQMTKAMITKINDQTNDHITNDQPMIITQQHSACHITKLGISLININYITSELVRLREGC